MQPVSTPPSPRDNANIREETAFMAGLALCRYPGSGVTVIVRDLNVRAVSRLQPSR
jgi:hypothetical protein